MIVNKKILLVYNYKSKFVDIDESILHSEFSVKSLDLNKFKLSGILRFLTTKGVHVYWFVSFKTFPLVIISHILGNKVKIISGGFDVSDIRGYGMYSSTLGRVVQNIQFRISETILVNSRSSYNELLSRSPNVSKKLCFLHHVLDYSPLKLDWHHRDIEFITIGSVKSVNMKRKGISSFLQLAKVKSESQFVLIGPVIDEDLVLNIPNNVRVTGYVSEEEKLNLLRRAKYYCQFSQHEGFGLSALEAQIQGCCVLHNGVGGLKESVVIGQKYSGIEHLCNIELPQLGKYEDAIALTETFSYEFRALGLKEFIKMHHE